MTTRPRRAGHRRRPRHRRRHRRDARRAGYAVVALDCASAATYPGVATRSRLGRPRRRRGEFPTGAAAVADVRDRDALEAAVADVVRFGPPRRRRRGRRGDRRRTAAVGDAGRATCDTLWDIDVRGVWNTAAASRPRHARRPGPVRLPLRRHRLGRRRPRPVPPRRLHRRQARRRRPRAGPRRRPGRHRRHRVAVSPGSTDTAMLAATADLYDRPTPRSSPTHQLLRRLLEPDEIAATIALLLLREGAALNGSVVHADGGFRPMTAARTASAVRLGAGVRVRDGGRTLVGGSPLRVQRHLEPAAPASCATERSWSRTRRRAGSPSSCSTPAWPNPCSADAAAHRPRPGHRRRPGP